MKGGEKVQIINRKINGVSRTAFGKAQVAYNSFGHLSVRILSERSDRDLLIVFTEHESSEIIRFCQGTLPKIENMPF